MTSRILTKGKGGLRRGAMACAFCSLMLPGWQLAHGLAVDTRSYDPGSGVEVKAGEEELTMRWKTPEGSTELILNVSGKGALVRSVAVGSKAGKPVVILRDANPLTVLSVGQRDLKKRGGWTIFFDPTNRKLSKSGRLALKLKSVVVHSVGRRCMVDLDGLEGGGFSGKFRFTLYAGCDLIHLQAIVETGQDARALLYHAGLTCEPAGKSVSWVGLDDKLHRVGAKAEPAMPVKVRNRTIALETRAGSVAVFPPPHRYFYPLDEAYNLGFTWKGNDFMGQKSGFGIGIRQDLMGDERWVPWFNAPPGTQQELGIFWLASLDRGEALFERVRAYTHGDRFVALPGHKTFTSHYHIEHTTNLLNAREKRQASAAAEVVKTSRRDGQSWRYSLTRPPGEWIEPSFDDGEWKQGKGGFGKQGTPGLRLGTEWHTQDIWMRRRFKLKDVPADGLKLSLLYDEDTQVYLNGVLACSVKGFSKKYREVSISPEARKTLKQGDNLLAVHCWNDGGGQAIDVGLVRAAKGGLPKEIRMPEFVDVFKGAGIDIVHLAEFHNRLGRDRRDPDKTLPLLKMLHDECDRLSDEGFLLLPGEEPNAHLGGHWISFFPRPVMWVLRRSRDKPFIEEHPEYGRVYHVGSPGEVLKLMEQENGLMWAAHPRIKSSTGYPDKYRDEPFFKSGHYLGGAWKAMPADLSRNRLGWRVLDLLDDMSNWGARKYIVGEVDIFQVDRTTEFYAHANINYLRLDHVPRFRDGWDPVLRALRDGAFFISTGEVLMPRFTLGGKQSGETLKLAQSGKAVLEVALSWTFPMKFIEIITGDGEKVYRQQVELSESGAFGKQDFRMTLDLKGKTWVRVEGWDIATNGVISQPVWLE
ncbi:MAG: hypothetical protein MK183_01500 [Verrucomicrobiales bacterium]|nr:hypothetical protein [Verrucomicrobiales bacterium]